MDWKLVWGVAGAVGLISLSAGCRRETEMAVPVPVMRPAVTATSKAEERPSGILPSFRMIGTDSGFEFERYDGMQGLRRIIEANGGGVAVFDFDRDGWLDVYMTNGCELPLSRRDHSRQGEFFRNRGNMRFERLTIPSQLVQFGYSHGCAVGDYDADGFDDVYITAYGPNALWRNNGDGTFTDVTGDTGTAVPQWSSSAAFADVNGDGHVDLYVVNYLEESDESPTLCPHPESPDGHISCPPAMFDGVDDVLFLSEGNGEFRDVTEAAGIGGLNGNGLGVVITDLGGDARPEIYVANDGQANFLFVPRTADASVGADAVSYEERALISGVALSEAGYAQASMGVAAGDYDANGMVDLFLTHFYDDTNTLYANRGGLVFEDKTRGSNLGATSRETLGFGTVFIDADNDGWLDLFLANGHVDDRTWAEHPEPYRMRPQMYRNHRDGTFDHVSNWSGDYFAREWLGRGAATGDLDRDGRLDMVVSHQLSPSAVLQNDTGTKNHSLTLRLVGTSSNRNGYCARVELVDTEGTVVHDLAGGGSFQSASAPEVHVGLGMRSSATVRIRWLSGSVELYSDLQAGEWIAIEGKGTVRAGPVANGTL